MTDLHPYPSWVCAACAEAAGGERVVEGALTTWHIGQCGVCVRTVAVTEPRYFGYPRFAGFERHPSHVSAEVWAALTGEARRDD